MKREMLFIRTLEDLEQCIASKDSYEILQIAGLLRKLLLDKHSLVDQVNARRRLKIRFEVGRADANDILDIDPQPDFWTSGDSIDPATCKFSNRKPVIVTRQKFYSIPVMMINNQKFTVKDVILHAAHVQGAIHAGEAQSPKDEALIEVSGSIFIKGLSSVLQPLLPIGKIVLNALVPLRKQIITEFTK